MWRVALPHLCCYRRDKLFDYEFTLKKLNKSHYKLERLKKKHKIKLSKKNYKREKERQKMIFETLTSQTTSISCTLGECKKSVRGWNCNGSRTYQKHKYRILWS